jgi:hypothetical protein
MGFFNKRSNARAVLTEPNSQVSLFACRLLPVRFEQGRAEDLEIDSYPVEPLNPSFITLGFDAVSRRVSSFFEFTSFLQ